ncbi:HAMP domain-containing sensor histidine kinase, partial [bacterium]|nr:HAMP domain-containing sensor histidine kinase [bacterium]
GQVFTRLSNDVEVRAEVGNYGQLDEREERLSGVLLIKAREMFSASVRLAKTKQIELATIRERLNLSVVVLFMSLATVISIISALGARKIIASIARLRSGMETVAAGNLNHHVEPLADDELGHLAKAFNGMTEKLQSADAGLRDTVAALRQEVAVRKRAEEKARCLNNQLEEAVTALEEEIADHRQTGEELRNKERLLILQSRQAAMGEMIGNIAHQWRQPLNLLALIIQSLPESSERGGLSDEHLKRCSEKSMQVITHMSQTIDDFRNFFRPDKEKEPFRVRDAVSRAVSIIEGSFASSAIKIETQAAGDPVINGYPNEFSQVLINILLNARDALDERKVDNPRVTITIDTNGGKSVVVIADNGGGIPEEIMDKIFEPYFTTRGPDRGTG